MNPRDGNLGQIARMTGQYPSLWRRQAMESERREQNPAQDETCSNTATCGPCDDGNCCCNSGRTPRSKMSAAAGNWASVAARTEPATCLSGGPWRPRGCEPRDRDTKASAEVFGCGMHGEVMGGRPQVELASGGMALEAAVAMRRQIGPEVAALRTAGLVYRARATEPTAVAATGDEAQERQDLLDRDLRSQLGKVDGWHDQRIRQSRPGREEDRVINPWPSAAVSISAFRRPLA